MKRLFGLLISLSMLACSSTDNAMPEQTGHSTTEPSTWDKGAMVAAANPHAVNAAIAILQEGGHAVDAAIAAHAVLGLVEPQSSGIGGGAFMLVYEQAGRELTFHDGRETAPAGARVDMFMRDGQVMDFYESWQSGVAVGVPGTIALYKAAHKQHGKLPWSTLFAPAITLAEAGFEVSPRMAGFLPRVAKVGRLDENPVTAAYFFPNGQPLKPGHLLKNPEYAHTLRRIATEGPDAFYQGEIAEAIAEAAQQAPNPGSLTATDIGNYRALKRDVVCGQFRRDKICTTTPPSSGGAQIMIAGIYDHLSAKATTQDQKIAAFIDAQRLAYADRDYYFGDPDAVDVPLEDLINPAYLKHRASMRFAPNATPEHGDPRAFLHPGQQAGIWGADTTEEVPGTTHLSIVDGAGNAVALTASVEAPFGSSRMVGGFLLNNQMTDFARKPSPDGKPVANAIAPGRRPRSSMSPTMVFDQQGNILMVTGSPGGNSIPAYVAKTIIGVLDWDLSAQQAVDFPNLVARGERVRVEVSVEPGKAIAAQLKKSGYPVQERKGENSGLHVIVVGPDTLDGAADSRREGIVRSLEPGFR
ncbi:MAG: gamma-glutamyltransferase [Halieaceae bacterium]|jgi:gamma-glutamyltranspeptidase / glutathione hydrolase|nr:gamma-glutamyltransferase [Halieaceae bacterium]